MVKNFERSDHRVAPAFTPAPNGTPRFSLVVLDAMGSGNSPAGPLIQSVADHARRAGFSVSVASGSAIDHIGLGSVETTVVLLPIYLASPRGLSLVESLALWEAPATVSTELTARGFLVIVVTFGAPAALLAACVAHGAVGLEHVEDLDPVLRSFRSHIEREPDGTEPASTLRSAIDPPPLPRQYNALLHLTSAERRILNAMMQGWAATDIATSLVVSVSTVRTHIRSILTKLNVSSQIGAVAIGFGVDAGYGALEESG